MERYRQAYSDALVALDAALVRFTKSVPPPSEVHLPHGRAYRFEAKSLQQALVIKCVRMSSALRATHLLLESGLMLDAGALMRVLDEITNDISFLAGPILYGHAPEPNHQRYLAEFFQEEFEGKDVLNSRIKRNRVSRSKIRAYVARTYGSKEEVESHIAVYEFIENVFSGFVHGAYVHTMDLYNGRYFSIPMDDLDGPLAAMIDQYGQYIQRALNSFRLTAMALRQRDIFDMLHKTDARYFDEYGDLRTQIPR